MKILLSKLSMGQLYTDDTNDKDNDNDDSDTNDDDNDGQIMIA